jgi:hypothetical protein
MKIQRGRGAYSMKNVEGEGEVERKSETKKEADYQDCDERRMT